MPTAAGPEQVAPGYVDAFTKPGRVLYRFDSVLLNRGGTLDLFRDPATRHAMQAIWAGGTPGSQPDPNQPPTGDGATIEDRTPTGASFTYSSAHRHWHF